MKLVISLKKFSAASPRVVLIQGFPTHHFPGQFFFIKKRPGPAGTLLGRWFQAPRGSLIWTYLQCKTKENGLKIEVVPYWDARFVPSRGGGSVIWTWARFGIRVTYHGGIYHFLSLSFIWRLQNWEMESVRYLCTQKKKNNNNNAAPDGGFLISSKWLCFFVFLDAWFVNLGSATD